MDLTRDQVLTADDRKTKTVKVDEWGKGATLTVITWNAKQRDQFDTYVYETKDDDKNLRSLFVAISVIDPETRKQKFTLQDIEALNDKAEAPLTRLWEAAMELNPVLTSQFEEIAKNS